MRLILSGSDIIKLYPDLVRVLSSGAKYKIIAHNGLKSIVTLSNEVVAAIGGTK